MSLSRGKYNENAAFVALKYGLSIGGKVYQAGDTIDTSSIPPRKKMQLFHANLIGYHYMVSPVHGVAEPVVEPVTDTVEPVTDEPVVEEPLPATAGEPVEPKSKKKGNSKKDSE